MSEQRDRPSAEPEQGPIFGLDEIGHFTSLELDEVVDYLAEQLARLHVFNRLAIYLVDEQRRRLEVVRDLIACDSSVEGTGGPLFLTPRTGAVGHHYSLDSEVAAAIVVATPEIVERAHDVLAPDEEDHEKDDEATISCLIPIRRGAQVLAVAVGSCPAESRDGLLERLEDLSPLWRRVAVALGHALLYRRVLESEHSARVSLSLQTVRNAILRMESARDWAVVLNALYRELGHLVDFHECSISLLEEGDVIHGFYWEAGQSYLEYRMPTPAPIAQAIESGEPFYRRDVQELKKSGEERMVVDHGVRSLVDVPFARGTLAMNSVDEEAFSESDIDVLCQFAAVMSEAHRRLQDLEALGVKDRELQQSQKMEAIGQLTAGIAHNFNNMLQGVIGNLELALVEATPEIRTALENAMISADRATEMVQELLMFTRQGMRRAHRPVDVRKVLADTEGICRRTFDRKIAIDVDIGDIPAILGDSMQLQQVFLNLCINARDALDLHSQDPPRIQIEAVHRVLGESDVPPEASPGSYLCVSVSDNGVGMDAATQERAFEPFFTTKSVDRGTGLGLSTAFGIVRDHNGWMTCGGEPGAGSHFDVYLPASSSVADTPAKPSESSTGKGTETILLVDDEAMVRTTAGQMLEMRGYEVLYASDGHECLEICNQMGTRIDLVLLDQSMPRMSGQDVLAELQRSHPQLKVVIITGFAVDLDDFAGALDIIQKPFSLKSLVSKVRDVLDLSA